MVKKLKHIGVFYIIISSLLIFLHVGASSYGWGLPRSKNHQPPYPGDKYNKILNKYNSVYIGNTDKKMIYLTFDTGYEIEDHIIKILDILKMKNVPATFFVCGHYLKNHPDAIIRMADEGHIVGNHSWGHPDMTRVNDERFGREIEKLSDEYRKITGREMPYYFRPPKGTFNERLLGAANDLGYTTVFWSLAFKDWEINNQHGWKYSYNNIMSRIHPGAIILLHTVSKDNVDALPKVIEDLRNEGYEFASLDDLMLEKVIN